MASAASPPPDPSSAATTSRVSQDTIHSAVNALIQWRDNKSKTQKPQLLPQDDFIYLILTLKKIPPKGRTNPHKIPLPHPLHQPSSELCLIIDDRPKSQLTSDVVKKKIKSEDIPVAKVLKLSKLRSDYRPFEAKRKLCDSYDVFFADKRVVPLLPRLLGKLFFKRKKLPLTVDLTHKNWKEQIERACSSALLYVKTGTCSVVRVGKVSMEIGELVENAVAAIDGIAGVVPKKWAGVRSIHLKISDSLALPVYQALPDMKLKIEGIKVSEEVIKEEDGGEVEVKEESKKDKKFGKKKASKKGRIHEVRYMDAYVGGDELDTDDDEDENEGEKNEDNELDGAQSVGKERKKGDLVKKRFLSELNGEKRDKNMGNVKKGVSDDVDDGDEKSENDDLGSAEFEDKKRKKGGSAKGKVLSELNGEKRAKKTRKVDKGDGGKQKKHGLVLTDREESGGKKGEKKSELGTKLKNGAIAAKVKKSKRKHSAE